MRKGKTQTGIQKTEYRRSCPPPGSPAAAYRRFSIMGQKSVYVLYFRTPNSAFRNTAVSVKIDATGEAEWENCE